MTQVVSKAVGIDLGTTNSAVGIMDPTDTEIIIHRDEVSRARTTPSCVWRDPATGELVVGRKAFNRIGSEPEPIQSIKRLMGSATTVDLAGREMTPEEVSAAILAELKRQIEQDVARLATEDTSWLVDRAIVTVPAYFDQPMIDATRKAGEMAGLEVLDLLHEPTAAACHHCWRTKTRNGTFLVYDLGGGTFDVSVVRATAGVYEVLGISGNNRLGGDDIDRALAGRLQEMLVRMGWALELDPANDPADRLRLNQLALLAEGVKKGLSTSTEYPLRDPGRITDKLGNPVSIDTMFDRSDLEEVARPFIERTIPYCHEALARTERKDRAKLELADIDQVILAGGSTHMPLVREIVAAELCAGTRSKEPVYEQVDTVVALGAAVRAAVIGGQDVYDADRTVRVSFRGASATGATRTHIGGTVTALAPGRDLTGGRVRLIGPDDYEDEADIEKSGTFRFTGVQLEPGIESQFAFEILDADDDVIATVGRSITQDDISEARLPRPSSLAITTKPLLLEVSKAGKVHRKQLVPAMEELPTSAEYSFSHPGDTEAVLFPLYQHSKKIQVITVPVPLTTPRGTPIRFDLHVDRHSFITVRGSVGEHAFEAAVELPPEREMPTREEVERLDRRLAEAAEFLPAGERQNFQIKQRMARESLEKAMRDGDRAQAVHEFEQLEGLEADAAKFRTVLEPPKAEFDQLVAECFELNSYLMRDAAELSRPYDGQEMAKSIETQRDQGENAHRNADQRAYGEVIRQLLGYQQHMVAIYRQAHPQPQQSDAERAMGVLKRCRQQAEKVRQLADAAGRADLRAQVVEIMGKLDELQGRLDRDPRGVLDRLPGLQQRLSQLHNILMNAPVRDTGPGPGTGSGAGGGQGQSPDGTSSGGNQPPHGGDESRGKIADEW
ncbi:Hsp70 family protein [Actinomadura sp. KC216]|uniref:Hsp70 family protein n=1 Tax=Actinomadura sp. KC216 TaxID=2530370 RepID=UPI00104B9EF1|nr:Hsp70 family protein [Actinomadura sp. KC216]TDB91400.1 Hsp70 family protein [Actinomadura sp. KC216]